MHIKKVRGMALNVKNISHSRINIHYAIQHLKKYAFIVLTNNDKT